jgi:glycosyltransferase involved in cell wall biosynthesis
MKKKLVKKEDSEVTIMIPTFNRSGYLQEAIASAMAQTYPCHIIVCDHGSTDDTPQVMKKYKTDVTYIRREEDFGPHFCWLDGVLHSKTKYVKILYDDDWIEPTFVEKTIALMKDDVSCVITNAMISFESEKGKRIEKTTFYNKTGVFSNFYIKHLLLLFAGVISPTAVLFRKEELLDGIYQGKLPKKGGNYYHGVGPDMFVMLLGFLRYPKIGFVNEYLATFRAHEKSITMDAIKQKETKKKIQKGYEDIIEFYSFLRYFKLFRLLYFFSPLRILRMFLKNNIELIKKIMKGFTNEVS